MKNTTYIIAEAGVNHNGSFEMACKLVDIAKAAGADAVKFQTFNTDLLVTKKAPQAAYQSENMGKSISQYEMLKKLELSFQEFHNLSVYCHAQNIEFLSTPFDTKSVDFLVDNIHIKTIKIPSGELTNSPFIHYISTKRLPIILSTGMATIKEIHDALSFIAYGLSFPSKDVQLDCVKSFYKTEASQKILKDYVTVLHCTTSYPTELEDVNLNSMGYLREELMLSIGFSDHSEGILVPIAAVAKGAKVIEKHFTMNKSLPGPDHKASLNPTELADMVTGIRLIEKTLGTLKKEPTNREMKNRDAARKSLFISKDILAGETFSKNHICIKRPGNGMSPLQYWNLLGKQSSKDYKEGDMIEE